MFRLGTGRYDCPFGRAPYDDKLNRYIKRMELGNTDAYFTMGTSYMYDGRDGTPQDVNYALELLLLCMQLNLDLESHK